MVKIYKTVLNLKMLGTLFSLMTTILSHYNGVTSHLDLRRVEVLQLGKVLALGHLDMPAVPAHHCKAVRAHWSALSGTKGSQALLVQRPQFLVPGELY